MARAGMTLAPIANSTTTQQLRWLAQIKSPLLFTPHHSANFRCCDAHSTRWAGASMRIISSLDNQSHFACLLK
jgi:hypothetical protein